MSVLIYLRRFRTRVGVYRGAYIHPIIAHLDGKIITGCQLRRCFDSCEAMLPDHDELYVYDEEG